MKTIKSYMVRKQDEIIKGCSPDTLACCWYKPAAGAPVILPRATATYTDAALKIILNGNYAWNK